MWFILNSRDRSETAAGVFIKAHRAKKLKKKKKKHDLEPLMEHCLPFIVWHSRHGYIHLPQNDVFLWHLGAT